MNLVVAMAAGYTVPQLRNFVCSFKQRQENDVLLLLQDTDGPTRQWLHERGVLTMDVAMDIHPEFARFFAMHEMLRALPEYTRIFHADVRDVVTQDDIFARLPEPGLHVFREDAALIVGKNRVNSVWIAAAYDEETLARYSPETVICSGTTLGDRESFLVYTKAMTEEYERIAREKDTEFVVHNVRDQALHMHLVYSGELERLLAEGGRKLIIHDNGEGVLTLGKAREFIVGKSGVVLTGDKRIPAIVHQYDRYDFLQEMFDALYAGEEQGRTVLPLPGEKS